MEDKFTAGQVAVLIEELKGEFRFVVEVVSPIPERLANVEKRLGGVEERLTAVEDALRIAVPDLSKRVTRLEGLIKR